ncbi:hypothetical protein SCOCK_730020 [Actinacidiphila cocklensis]|uniref:Uncharacterized protein n=1 Tax=Actinacidiphila cocklensis TaxID=887465 RepID=A0A9W4DY86_9ACTN|nr:hypothetical protein SCOCK_730020 [Actinacidiphila cocklensis]
MDKRPRILYAPHVPELRREALTAGRLALIV